MKKNYLKLATVGLLVWSLGAQAQTVYQVNRTVGSGSISGTIETNGTIGPLSPSDILNWSFDANDGTDIISISSTSGGFLQGNAWSYFSATSSQLLFDFDGALADAGADLISFHGQDNPQTFSFDYNLVGNFLGKVEQLVHQFGAGDEHLTQSFRTGVAVIGAVGGTDTSRPGVVHQVHVGGPDACRAFGLAPGCDGNFSLTANEFSDGEVNGAWTDRFGNGTGVTAEIDCLFVDGNEAWVSGYVVTTNSPRFVVGEAVTTRVRDNGVSSLELPDETSFTIRFDAPCTDARTDYPMFLYLEGQVTVR